MSTARVQVTIPHDSGLPKDRVSNTWHCSTTDLNPLAGTTEFVAALATFYQAIDGNFGEVYGSPATVKCYDLNDAEPRVPFYETTFALVVGSNQLPQEVAVCLSFQAERLSGFEQASRRNRVFLPVNAPGAFETATGLVLGATVTSIVNAADALLAASATDSDWSWVVYSPKTNITALVNNGWVDNAPDTMRSRERLATSRVTFS